MLDAVRNDIGKLPLLEYALKETWQRAAARAARARLTLDAYGAGRRHRRGGRPARRRSLRPASTRPSKAAARRLFVSLVTPGEGREDTRARVAYPDDAAMAAVVRTFSGRRCPPPGHRRGRRADGAAPAGWSRSATRR